MGQIVAVKGLGGFHLACDATQQQAVEQLRQRKRRPGKPLAVMLPANPLQHLLLALADRPLVMTSGNASGKPPALTNTQALDDLTSLADLWLLNNRDIVLRADDSLVRCNDGAAEMLRRARGYVPDAFSLPPGFEHQPALLAMGADLKNTFCLLRDSTL